MIFAASSISPMIAALHFGRFLLLETFERAMVMDIDGNLLGREDLLLQVEEGADLKPQRLDHLDQHRHAGRAVEAEMKLAVPFENVRRAASEGSFPSTRSFAPTYS